LDAFDAFAVGDVICTKGMDETRECEEGYIWRLYDQHDEDTRRRAEDGKHVETSRTSPTGRAAGSQKRRGHLDGDTNKSVYGECGEITRRIRRGYTENTER
jgi:hypothetical protein